jgi:AraC-like DNA-binding protein
MLVPAGSPAWARTSACKDQLFIFLEPGVVARVAAEAFDLDPARVSVPPRDGLDLPPRRPARGRDGALPRGTLRAVVAYIEAHLDAGLTLAQLAAAAHRSAYHFARPFTAATGMPPHQHVIASRVARAQQLLHPDRDLSLAEIAARVGFSDQSQFSQHFKRVVGVTPRQFRRSASIA